MEPYEPATVVAFLTQLEAGMKLTIQAIEENDSSARELVSDLFMKNVPKLKTWPVHDLQLMTYHS